VADDRERKDQIALSLVYVGAEETPAVLRNLRGGLEQLEGAVDE
jgi:hypothetical protein